MIKFLYLLCLVTVLSLSVLAHAHNRPLYHAPRMHRIPRGLNTRELSAHAHDGSSPLNKRITEEQAWQKASLDCWNDAFLKMNAKWQQAVQAGWEVDFNTFSTKNGGLPEPLKCTSGADCTASTKSSSSKSHGAKSTTHAHQSSSHASKHSDTKTHSTPSTTSTSTSLSLSLASLSSSSSADLSVSTHWLQARPTTTSTRTHASSTSTTSTLATPRSTTSTSMSSTSTTSTSSSLSTSYACTFYSGAENFYSLIAKTPSKLQAIESTLVSAADALSIQPQLLVAIAMIESTGGSDSNAYSNGGGMFQFTDQSAWAEYGDGGSRTNDNDGAWAAARYLATLCGNNGGSLWQALREYNGSGEGANWSYQETIYAFMSGNGF